MKISYTILAGILFISGFALYGAEPSEFPSRPRPVCPPTPRKPHGGVSRRRGIEEPIALFQEGRVEGGELEGHAQPPRKRSRVDEQAHLRALLAPESAAAAAAQEEESESEASFEASSEQ